MRIKNKELENNIIKDEKYTAFLEGIGIEIYAKYGIDCYNYHISGSPVDVEYINKTIKKANINTNKSINDIVFEIVRFWDENPEY